MDEIVETLKVVQSFAKVCELEITHMGGKASLMNMEIMLEKAQDAIQQHRRVGFACPYAGLFS